MADSNNSAQRCMIAFVVFALSALSTPAEAQRQRATFGRIEGVLDTAGAPVSVATEGAIRVLEALSHAAVTAATIRSDGSFQAEIRPGSYIVVARLRGFHPKRLSVVIRSRETVDLGTITLASLGCDSGFLVCDSFAPEPRIDPVLGIPIVPDSILRNGFIELKIGCGLDVRTGASYCADSGQRVRVDVRLIRDPTGIFLEAIEGATLHLPNGPPFDCKDAGMGESKIRVDGMGPGDDICVQVGKEAYSHVVVVDDVEPNGNIVTLRYTTRRR